jgi:TRAP-type C4-dicarboxylate transport system permease small subunit
MNLLKPPNDLIARVLTAIATSCLVALSILVLYGVIMRYVFDNAIDYVEPIALLLVIVIAFFGAALRVRDGGHIGLDSLVNRLSPKWRQAVRAFQQLCLIAFALAIIIGSIDMAATTMDDHIPIIGISEAVRYVITTAAGFCIALFSLEHLLDMFSPKRI